MELNDREAREWKPEVLPWQSFNHAPDQSDSLLSDDFNGAGLGTENGEDRSSDSSMVGAGLMNLGNTCFLNVVLQCFTHTVALLEGLHCLRHTRCESGVGDFCVLCNFCDHVQNSLSCSGGIISPSIFCQHLNHFSSSFMRYAQEDAHEFLQCFLEKLERSLLDPKKANFDPSANLVERVFGGRLVSKLVCCECGHSSETFEPLTDISLEIEGMSSITNALESFTKVEKIEDLQCEKCKKEVVMAKQLLVDKAPVVSVLHLKRFKANGIDVQKINTHVEFPLELDFGSYTVSPNADNMELKYDLYGVAVHDGYSPYYGHYHSFVRSASDTWHSLDDSSVTRVPGEFVLSQQAYMLFYTKRGTPWFSSLMSVSTMGLVPKPRAFSPKSVLENASRDVSEDASAATNCLEKAESTVTYIAIDDDKDYGDDRHNVLHLLTPPRPQTPDPTPLESPGSLYRIPRRHVKSEEQVCRKRSVNRAPVDPERKEAMRYMSRTMPSSRGSKLMAAMFSDEAVEKKRKLGHYKSQSSAAVT